MACAAGDGGRIDEWAAGTESNCVVWVANTHVIVIRTRLLAVETSNRFVVTSSGLPNRGSRFDMTQVIRPCFTASL